MELAGTYFKLPLLALIAVATIVGCSSSRPSFSLLPEQSTFDQAPTITLGKLDILWVIDNSGSMKSSQDNVAANFASFIDLFNQKGYDYHMAVITSEAYKPLFGADASMAKFRDGTDDTSHSGMFVIDPQTPDLTATFLTNMIQGINGSGDERPFQSIKTALQNDVNAPFDFPRKDAFLAVIIVSDEDDFSHDGPEARGGQYNYSKMHTVESYVSFLDTLTGGTPENRKFNVSSIAILDQTCLDTLNAEVPGRKIGVRYQQMSESTNGVVGSLCGNFAETLREISNRIVKLTAQFPLSRLPNPDTIQVWVDGVTIPRSETNGWTYNAANNSIVFAEAAIPDAGSKVSISFDPITIK